ncbi:MAG: hypothetical protein PUP46_02445 [Endozoicomonas sp. (ex Botrylloides leachii)]|nr:hypothetical protein [Endozoicomonas sp. (ex Botrylloides leachii)]
MSTTSLLASLRIIRYVLVEIKCWPAGLVIIYAFLIQGCASNYPSSFIGCAWQANFPAPPHTETIFKGRIAHKQRMQAEYQGRLYRASYTVWNQHTKHKETDRHWINRVQRCLKLNILSVYTKNFPDYTVTHIVAKKNDDSGSTLYYWLDSYFNGQSRYALVYRQSSPEIDAIGRKFLNSVKRRD